MGGAHGWYAAELCLRHRGLKATVLDLEGSARVGRDIITSAGLSHLVTAPAPEILELLGRESLTCAALLARLGERFDLADASVEALDARLGELVATGLVEAA